MDLLKSVTIEIGKRLRSFREQLDLSQKEFAEKLKVPANYISRYESGLHLPSSDMVKKLKKTFGLNEFWLATGHEMEGLSMEDWRDFKQLVREHVEMQDFVGVVEFIWSHSTSPLTIALFQEKFHISFKKAKSLLLQLLQHGTIIGIGNDSYMANPFYPFGPGIVNYADFLKRVVQLSRIYIAGDIEKVARVGGMLDMADPGLDFIKKYLSRLEKEKESTKNTPR